MATTMCLLLLVPALLLLLSDLQIIQCGGMSHDDGSNIGKDESALGKPSNVTVSCLNLNYTLHWNPPSSSSEDGTVYYTVYYFGLGFGWLPLPSCVNITQHSCYIFPVFNTHDDVFRDLKVSVQAHDEAGSTGAPANVTFNPLTNATVGAPTVTLPPEKIGPYEAVAYLKAPISPIGDTVVTQQLTEISIKYNISVWKQTTKILEKSLASSIDMTHLTDLRPDTSYELRVFTTYDTMYGMKYSPDVATSTFTTKQKSPSYGPDIFLGRISEPNCAQPNIRNITIKWKAPPVDSWNGQIPTTR
ncbi:interferon alpha/beta receptor 1-like isoform X2 [Amphiura filiformis]|uniref:interferon alpha/beta receptor 1-like isoform X2 n=1 Tax=Amphiura filiformis TaxID=82378 RepID=UPI003B211B20